jgi:acyl carrier protein
VSVSNHDKLMEVFRITFELGPEIDVWSLRYNEIPAWDSVGHMMLVAAIENAFDVMIDTDDVLAMDSPEKAVEILKRHDVIIGP